DQAIREVVADVAPRVEHRGGDLEVAPRLRAHSRGVRGCVLVNTLVLHAVLLLKLLAQLPEELAVHRVRGPVRGVVVLEVAAPLACAEPADAWDARWVVTARGLEHDLRDGIPLAALFGADDAPTVRLEPVARAAVHNARHRVHVDAEVVPVEKEHQVRKAEAPRGVARLVTRARREPALTLDREDLHLFRARDLQRDGLAHRRRHAVTRGPGVPFEEQRLARHLGVTGKTAVAAEPQQVLPGEREHPVEREREALVGCALMPHAHRFVERREGRVNERYRVTRRQDDAIAEAAPRPQQIPTHRAGQHQCEKQMDLRARAAGMTALPVVQGEIDELVDDVLGDLPQREGRRGVGEEAFDPGSDRASHRAFCSTICAVSGSARVIPETVRIPSEGETLLGDLYGVVPTRRAAILVHGQQWDASGWRDVAARFVERGLPALALNLRGYDGSSGKTNRWSSGSSRDEFLAGEPWSPIADLRAAKALLRDRGAREIALVGASMGGHAILASSFEADVESIVSVSAPVVAVSDELSRRITGRKLFVCADGDPAAQHVLHAFDVVSRPKTLVMFGGSEHSRGMFAAPYGPEAVDAIVDFVARGT